MLPQMLVLRTIRKHAAFVFILERVPFALPCSTGVINVPIENLYVQSSQIFGGTFTDYKMAMYANLTAVEFRVTAAPGS